MHQKRPLEVSVHLLETSFFSTVLSQCMNIHVVTQTHRKPRRLYNFPVKSDFWGLHAESPSAWLSITSALLLLIPPLFSSTNSSLSLFLFIQFIRLFCLLSCWFAVKFRWRNGAVQTKSNPDRHPKQTRTSDPKVFHKTVVGLWFLNWNWRLM